MKEEARGGERKREEGRGNERRREDGRGRWRGGKKMHSCGLRERRAGVRGKWRGCDMMLFCGTGEEGAGNVFAQLYVDVQSGKVGGVAEQGFAVACELVSVSVSG